MLTGGECFAQAMTKTYWWVVPLVWFPFVAVVLAWPLRAGMVSAWAAALSFLFGMVRLLNRSS